MSEQEHSSKNIPPNSPTPPEALIAAAMRDVPPTLADLDNTTEYGAGQPEPGQRIVLHARLVRALAEKGQHVKAAAEWAIHRLVEQRMLTIHPGRSSTPGVIGRDGTWKLTPISYELRDLQYSLVHSMPRLWQWWREWQEELIDAHPVCSAGEPGVEGVQTPLVELPATLERNTFRFEGDLWTLTFVTKTVRLKDSLGLKYIAQLLASKHRYIDAAALRSAATGNVRVQPSAGFEILDRQAFQEYQAEYDSLTEQLAEAKEFNDLAKQECLQGQLHLLAEQLKAARGFGSRRRKVKDEMANVRTAVKNAISRAIEKQIGKAHPQLARHLDLSIRTGQSPCYSPDPDVDWEL